MKDEGFKKLYKWSYYKLYRFRWNLEGVFCRIINGFKNISKYWKVIWKQYDWDYAFLLDLLIFKLESMEKYFTNDSLLNDNDEEQILKELKATIKPLKELLYERHAENETQSEYKDRVGETAEEFGKAFRAIGNWYD